MRSTTPVERPARIHGARIALALALAAAPTRAPAATFTGDLNGRYSSIAQYVTVIGPDGTSRRVRQSAALWSQEYRAGYSTALPMRTSLVAEMRYLDVSSVGRADHATTPFGLLRLTGPILGVNMSYQPSRRTFEANVSGDTVPEWQRLTSRFADFQFGAYVAPRRLPRVDFQYNKQHHFADSQSPEGSSILRTLRAVQDFRILTVNGGYSDQANRQNGTGQIASRTWNAGFDLKAPAGRRHTANLSYAYLRGERPVPGGWNGSDNHNINAYGTYRFTRRSWLNGGGFYRLSQIRSPRDLNVVDYDAYVYHNYASGRVLATRLGGGQHTFQDLGRTRNAPYLLATASAVGTPRPRWRGRANFTHSTNWVEARGPSSSESFAAGSTFQVTRTFDAHVEVSASMRSGAVILGPQPATASTSAGVRLQPLRSVSFTLDGASQTGGAALFSPRFRARSGSATLLWQPTRRMTLSASRSAAGAFPNNQPRTYSTAIAGTWQASRRFQLDGNYSNSSVSGATRPVSNVGRESLGFRLNGSLTRRLGTAVGYQVSGRGAPGELRALDVTATYRFEL